MFDRVLTVCLNPSLDTTIWLDNYDLDEPVRASREQLDAGGKSINVSRVLTSLGVPNKTITLVGRDNCKSIIEMLDLEHVRYKVVMLDGKIRENLSIVLPNGKMLKINRDGFSADDSAMLQMVYEVMDELVECKSPLAVFAGSLPRGSSKETYKTMIKQFCYGTNVPVAIDTDVLTERDIMDLRPFIIKPNQIELSHMAGRELKTIDEAASYAKTLTPYVNHVLVSMGAEGLLYVSKSDKFVYQPPRVEVKSTVGAGDTTLAGFIAALHNGLSIEEAVGYAGVCGTASVMLEGTAVIDADAPNRVLAMMAK